MENVIRVPLEAYLGGKNEKEAKKTKKEVDKLLRLTFKRNFNKQLYFADLSKFNSIFFNTLHRNDKRTFTIFRGEITDKYIGKLTAYQIALLCWGNDNWFGGEVVIQGNSFEVTINTD